MTAAAEWMRRRWWAGWGAAALLALLLFFRGNPTPVVLPPAEVKASGAVTGSGVAKANGGSVTVPTSAGPVVFKCPDLEVSNTCTAKVEVVYVQQPCPAVPLWTWQIGAGGGIDVNGPAYYVRVGRRLFGPVGLDVIGLYPPGVMAGVNVAWH